MVENGSLAFADHASCVAIRDRGLVVPGYEARLISGSDGGWATDRELRQSVQRLKNVQRIIADEVVQF